MKRFVYKDSKGLRVLVTYLTHSDKNKPDIVLLPMFHAADEDFYYEMFWERRFCDVVIFEAASRRLGKYATLIQKTMKWSGKTGLALQSEYGKSVKKDKRKKANDTNWYRPTPDHALETRFNYGEDDGDWEKTREIRFIKADLDDDQTEESLKGIPFWAWPLIPFAAILVAAASLMFITRKSFVDWDFADSSLDDALGRPDTIFGKLAKYIISDREAYLFKTLKTEVNNSDNAYKLLGVEYGAAHMGRAFEKLTNELGYEKSSSRSILCIYKDPNASEFNTDRCLGLAESRYKETYSTPPRQELIYLHEKLEPFKWVPDLDEASTFCMANGGNPFTQFVGSVPKPNYNMSYSATIRD